MSEALFPIQNIHVGHRFRRDLGDLDSLAESIDHVGLLHAIVVANVEGRMTLVAGERRLRACERLGWDLVPCRIVTTTDLLAAEHDENAVRLDFSPSEAVAIADALRPAAKAAAEERMKAGAPSEKSSEGRAEDQVAGAVGMSRPTLGKATDVVRAADADPTLQPLVEHMDETGKVEPSYKALKSLPESPSPEQVRAAIEPAPGEADDEPDMETWRELHAWLKGYDGLDEPGPVARSVPGRQRRSTAKRLRDVGEYVARLAWLLEGSDPR